MRNNVLVYFMVLTIVKFMYKFRFFSSNCDVEVFSHYMI